MNAMIAKHTSNSWLKRVLLAFVLLMNFRTFQYFPGMSNVQEAWLILSLLAFVTIYPLMKSRMDWQFSKLELYILILIPVAVLLPAFSASRVFGQPILYGILAKRAMVLIVTALLFLHGFRFRLIRYADLEAVLQYLAWGLFTLYTSMQLFLNPAAYLSYGPGFVVGVGAGDEFSFQFSETFLVFGVMYYAIRGFRTRRLKYYLLAGILLIGSLGHSGRSLSLSVAVTLLIFLQRSRRINQYFISIGKFIFAAAILLGVLYIVAPGALKDRAEKYSDALTVAFTGTRVEDASANARVLESAVATVYIKQNPFLGNGVLSHQWNGGNEGVIGSYFYEEDIGLLGAIYAYGIIGLLIFGYQYWFAWKATRDTRVDTLLSEAIRAFLLYTFIESLVNAGFVFDAEASLFFIAILSAIRIGVVSAEHANKSTLSTADIPIERFRKSDLPIFNS